MQSKHALILAFLITGLIASNYFLFQIINKPELETAIVARVIDADTLELSDGRTLRLLNINAPEKSFPNSEISTEFLKQYENKSIKFKNSEIQAISQGKGIWKHSIYYDCITSTIDKELEVITLTNICDVLDLKSWKLKDESRKTFTFPNIKLNKAQKLILYSKEGTNNDFELYWQQKTNVWNNDRDTLYLFDSNGFIIHFNSYG